MHIVYTLMIMELMHLKNVIRREEMIKASIGLECMAYCCMASAVAYSAHYYCSVDHEKAPPLVCLLIREYSGCYVMTTLSWILPRLFECICILQKYAVAYVLQVYNHPPPCRAP